MPTYENQPIKISLFDKGYDQFGQNPLTFTGPEVNSKSGTVMSDGIASSLIQSGDIVSRINVVDGYLQSDGFVTGSTGWQIKDDGTAEFNSGTFRGSLAAATIDIGGADATSFHVDIDGNMWWGADGSYAAASIKISSGGSVSLTTGTFAGSLSANTGTLGALTIASGGNIKFGQTAYNTGTGFWLGDVSGTAKFSIGDGSTKYLTWDGSSLTIRGTLNADDITAGTITGRDFKATGGTTGVDVWVNNDGFIRFRYDNSTKGFMGSDSSGFVAIDADDGLVLNSSASVGIYSDDEIALIYNDDGGSNLCKFIDDSSIALQLDDGRDAIFADDCQVQGDFSVVGSKDFKIDHPLKPETHWLIHSCIESPERLNAYKGRGKIKNGKFIIELPDYFEALNKDFEYNLTPIGQPANLYVSEEVKNNKVEVSSDVDCDFSWVVYGVRNDLYSQAHPSIPEVEKEIKGYARPELYGETQNLLDKIASENVRRKEKGLDLIPMQNKKGFIKIKSQSKLDDDALIIMRKTDKAKPIK